MARLSDPITILKGVGPARAKQFANLNIFTLRDLICHFPRGYEDRTKLVAIEKLQPDVPACFRAMVMNSPRTSHIRKGLDITRVQVADSTARLNLTFFNNKFAAEQLQYGKEYIFYGAVSGDFIGYNMTNPVFEAMDAQPVTTRRILPVYPLTAGLSNQTMLKTVRQAIAVCDVPAEILPEEVRTRYGILPAERAYGAIHEPNSMAEAELAKKRLIFEEFFVFSAGLALMRTARAEKRAEPYSDTDMEPFYGVLPFRLTGAQQRAIDEILADFKKGAPMNRLVQGDVGSGKTMVAVLTALIAIGNGFQACIMAPTEVLAQQHYKNIQKFLAPTGVKSALLTGSSKTSERREVHAGLEDGSIGIIVGTHALIEDNVVFRNLGLAIIDEQHRFGVEQRSKLWRKASCGAPPHVLVMTATPIPRTLAMTLYGDLDVSVIDELPPGRKPVQTIHATEGKRPAMYRFMRDEIAKGRQIFIVYPLINETEKLDYQSLEAGAEEIMQKFPFPDYKTAVVHGKQLNDVKKFNMDAFAAGRADILVATSVIEVGVDVPNASVMVIESAERFGLSQLHQLRGRVGRGSEKSYCVLMTGHKLSKESKHRIELMCATENGFELAEEDMKMRGPGDLEGTQQSGLPISLNIASLAKDGLILNVARDAAEAVLKEDPTLSLLKNQLLRNELVKDKYKIKDYSKIS